MESCQEKVTLFNKISGGGQHSWIASLRGIAALLVFVSHLPVNQMPYELRFFIGRVGVAVFFLIAGYLSVSARMKRNGGQYLFNRLTRLYPVYWLLLLLMFLVKRGFSIRELLWNMTLFHEFVGIDCIIGASWMMPIQLCFFVMVSFGGATLFSQEKIIARICSIYTAGFILAGIGAVGISLLRYFTEKPFPTAFLLLQMVGLLGIRYKLDSHWKRSILYLSYFEVVLVVSVMLSYPDLYVVYFLAYNAALVCFFSADLAKIDICAMNALGNIGFCFFLGAGIPYALLTRLIDFQQSTGMIAAGCIVKFVLAVALSYLVTSYIEKPLLVWSKKVEQSLS